MRAIENCSVINFEESRILDSKYTKIDLGFVPVVGNSSFLHVELPDGVIFRLEIAHQQLTDFLSEYQKHKI